MKKFLSIILTASFLSLTFASIPGFSAPAKTKPQKKSQTKSAKQPAPKPQFQIPQVEDELINELITKGYPLKSKITYTPHILQDEEVVLSGYEPQISPRPLETEQGIAVYLKPIKKIKTKNSHVKIKKAKKYGKYRLARPYINERIDFKVSKDVISNGKVIIPKNSLVHARVSELSPKAMGGAPAELTLGNFELIKDDGTKIPLSGEMSIEGYSLAFWVALAELATTPFLFGIAVPVLRVLPGGQAVITPRKDYIIYYQENNNENF